MAKRKEPCAITVSFKPKIMADGEIERITIKQNDQEIRLTEEQARTLAAQINARYHPAPDIGE